MDAQTELTKRQKRRFDLLYRLYELADATPFVEFEETRLGDDVGLSRAETNSAVLYLMNKGLIEPLGAGVFAITQPGIDEVERAIAKPAEPTAHFPPFSVINFGTMTNPQIQQGTTYSQQTALLPPQHEAAAAALLQQVKDALPNLGLSPDDHEAAQLQVATVEAHLAAKRPTSAVIVRESFKSVRNIVEGILGGGVASAAGSTILPAIDAFLKSIPG